MIEEHTLPSLWQCLLVGVIAGPLGIYEQIQVAAQTNQACKTARKKKKQKKTLKHVVKQLTPLWVTHTETWHITSCCVCKQCTPHFLWLFHNQKKVYLDRSAYRSSEKLWFFQAAQQTLCVLFVLVWASRWWSDPAVNHCVASFFVFVLMWCTAATNRELWKMSETTSVNVLFCPQLKDIQFTAKEE